MNVFTLIYHDIELGPTPNRYSFSIREFREHLAAMSETAGGGPVIPGGSASGYALTFDDGHPGWLLAAEALHERGWKASFFVITGLIGRTGRLGASDIRSLASLGHEIGTHTVDHPRLMSSASDLYLLDQWSRSKAELENILGRPVLSGAVPGGDYSARVARAASSSGLRRLFTSEPVAAWWDVDDCRVIGRYSLVNGMSSRTVAAIAAGTPGQRVRQYLAWNIKKAVRAVVPRPYHALRKRLYPS